MKSTALQQRTKSFGLRIIRLASSLPSNRAADILGRQLLRSGTSVGANYRSAQRARSKAEFLSKLGVVEEECDESGYWLELLAESGIVKPARLADLIRECNEITAIIVSSIQTGKKRRD